ncbi:hypothetical protein MCAV_02270 [[Mycoplasma] cavipharyngis]
MGIIILPMTQKTTRKIMIRSIFKILEIELNYRNLDNKNFIKFN